MPTDRAATRSTRLAVLIAASVLGAGPVAHAAAPSADPVRLDELTWTELRDRIAAGTTTVLLPIGGTEQSGPHLALGKHNVRVRLLAERIAQQLGHAVVAPVLAYVPEGSITPPTEHMRWPGTITVPPAAFEAVLESAARSLRQAGLCHVVLLGDHGGYRGSLDRVAARVNRGWAATGPCRVHALPEYYRAATTDYAAILKSLGHGQGEIGTHAGLADTSLMLAVDPALVRTDALGGSASKAAADGVTGDPRRASAELGRLGADHIVEASVKAIRAAIPAPATGKPVP